MPSILQGLAGIFVPDKNQQQQPARASSICRSWSTKVHMLYEVPLFMWLWFFENDRNDWPGVYFYPRNSAKFSCPMPWHCCFARKISARKSASERPRSQRCILHPILLVLVPWESSGKEERWAALDRKVGMGDNEMIHVNMIHDDPCI